jgi:hypothetical protein
LARRGVEGLQSFFLRIDITQVIIHEADEPDAIVDFLDSHRLTSQASAEIDLLAIQTQAAAAGDDDSFVVERVVRFADALIGAAGRSVDLRRTLHFQRFVRAFVIKLFQEGVELGLLLQEVGARRAGGFFFQGEMHALMPAILLGMAGTDPLNGNS